MLRKKIIQNSNLKLICKITKILSFRRTTKVKFFDVVYKQFIITKNSNDKVKKIIETDTFGYFTNIRLDYFANSLFNWLFNNNTQTTNGKPQSQLRGQFETY